MLSISGFGAVGSITQAVQQQAVITRQQKQLPGVTGAGIEMKDLIKTGTGRVSITFADNTRMQVTEHSRLLVDDFVYDPNKSTGRLAMKVALGTVRYASGAIAKNNPVNVNVRTPTATVGVRGTDFISVVDELGQSTVVLLPVCPAGWSNLEQDCVTGAITVSTEAATVFMNRPFQATFVSNADTSPTRPVILNIAEDAIKNLLIQSQPAELRSDQNNTDSQNPDSDPLTANLLANALDADAAGQSLGEDLLPNLLDQDFVANIVQQTQRAIAAQPRIPVQTAVFTAPAPVSAPVANEAKTALDVPVDFESDLAEAPAEGVKESAKKIQSRDADNNQVQIVRDGVNDMTITLIQNQTEIVNTLNVGGNTVIIIRQR